MIVPILLLVIVGAFCVWFFSEGATLQRQVAKRKHAAVKRGIAQRADLVVRMFSHLSGYHSGCYEDDVLTIKRVDSGKDIVFNWTKEISIQVIPTRQVVFRWEDRISDGSRWENISAYIPGEWERHLDLLHEKAIKIDQEWNREHDYKKRIRKDFGL